MNIKELIDTKFRGNVYIVQDNKVLCENVTGFADLANEIVKGTGASGAFISVKDITNFWKGLLEGKLVSFISEYNPNNGIISVIASNYAQCRNYCIVRSGSIYGITGTVR